MQEILLHGETPTTYLHKNLQNYIGTQGITLGQNYIFRIIFTLGQNVDFSIFVNFLDFHPFQNSDPFLKFLDFLGFGLFLKFAPKIVFCPNVGIQSNKMYLYLTPKCKYMLVVLKMVLFPPHFQEALSELKCRDRTLRVFSLHSCAVFQKISAVENWSRFKKKIFQDMQEQKFVFLILFIPKRFRQMPIQIVQADLWLLRLWNHFVEARKC